VLLLLLTAEITAAVGLTDFCSAALPALYTALVPWVPPAAAPLWYYHTHCEAQARNEWVTAQGQPVSSLSPLQIVAANTTRLSQQLQASWERNHNGNRSCAGGSSAGGSSAGGSGFNATLSASIDAALARVAGGAKDLENVTRCEHTAPSLSAATDQAACSSAMAGIGWLVMAHGAGTVDRLHC
jgi:hypothetical protein